MEQIESEKILPVPLYHGTSTLFLRGIAKHGLGGANPVADWKVLEFAARIQPLVEKHLAPLNEFMLRAGSFRRMVEQRSEAWNFQHGDTYLTPSSSTAIRYAANKRYGSEILTYTLDFLQALLSRKVDGVTDTLDHEFPQIFEKLYISAAPVLIRIDRVATSWLLAEDGGEAAWEIEQITKTAEADPKEVEGFCQQMNFRLRRPVPASEIKVWLLDVARPNQFTPEYVLHPLRILSESRDAPNA